MAATIIRLPPKCNQVVTFIAGNETTIARSKNDQAGSKNLWIEK
jgi:hypothetical protein